ncbi:MAG: tetratricopeptide repeat protein, partial [Ignavibacteria bacterium]
YNIKNFDKAEEITKLILKKKPDDYRAIFNLGSINATKGNKELAKKYWTEVIEKYPETEEAKQAREFLTRLK